MASVDQPWDVVVVGAGPAGLLCASRAAERGLRTLLVERNRKPGAKILMSGGTRCNLTHQADARQIVAEFGPAGRFLHSALAALDPGQLIEMFHAAGLPTKVEPGGKVFPASDRAADVRDVLLTRLKRSGCTLATEEPVTELARNEAGFRLLTPRRSILGRKLVLATGGRSYPGCGTTGDGYRWATELGHTVVPLHPALVPITTNLPWIAALQGLTLPDVCVSIIARPRVSAGRQPDSAAAAHATSKETVLACRRGSLLFTHFGLSGPVVLDVSRFVSGHPDRKRLALRCDWLPGIEARQLEEMLAQACAQGGKRHLSGIVAQWLPQRLVQALLPQAGVPGDCRGADFSRPQRLRLVQTVKQLDIPVTGTLGFEKAEVTAGGVALDEIDSRTMQSRRVPGLYVVGELLDLDGPIGGYNFQAAFSTGWLAGSRL